MHLTLNLNILPGAGLTVNYYDNTKLVWYKETPIGVGVSSTLAFIAVGELMLHQSSFPLQQQIPTALSAGKFILAIKKGLDFIWKSQPITVAGTDKIVRYFVGRIPADTTKIHSNDLNDGIRTPVTESIPNLSEDMRICTLDVEIKDGYVDIDGDGKIFQPGGGPSLIASDFDFDYDFKLKPARSCKTDDYLDIVPKRNVEIHFDNPITSIAGFFMQDTINRSFKRTVKNQLESFADGIRASKLAELNSALETMFPGTVVRDLAVVINKIFYNGDGHRDIVIQPGLPPIEIPLYKLNLVADYSFSIG